MSYRSISRTFPVVPGWDFSGDIVELGAEVEGQWQVGDKVMGLAFTWAIQHGTYAEYVPVDATAIAPMPQGWIPGGGAAAGKPDGLAVALQEYGELCADRRP